MDQLGLLLGLGQELDQDRMNNQQNIQDSNRLFLEVSDPLGIFVAPSLYIHFYRSYKSLRKLLPESIQWHHRDKHVGLARPSMLYMSDSRFHLF